MSNENAVALPQEIERLPRDGEPSCGVAHETGFVCTRRKGHSGDHCVHRETPRVVFRWPTKVCPGEIPDGHYGGKYLCSLEAGHSGPHVMFSESGREVRRWGNRPPELDDLLLKAQDLAEAMRKHNLTHLGQLQLR